MSVEFENVSHTTLANKSVSSVPVYTFRLCCLMLKNYISKIYKGPRQNFKIFIEMLQFNIK